MTTAQSDEALRSLEERTRALDAGEEPGMKVGDFVREPSADANADGSIDWKPGLIVTNLQSAGWTWLYETNTREPSLCNNNMLASQLKVKRQDGTYVFTTKKPSKPPWRGTIRCLLHKGRPEYPQMAAQGLIPQSGPCKKHTIPNEFQLMNHMRNKHPQEWSAISQQREEKERQEDREERQAILRSLTNATVAVAEPAVSVAPTNGSRKRKPMTEEQKVNARANLAKARAARGKK